MPIIWEIQFLFAYQLFMPFGRGHRKQIFSFENVYFQMKTKKRFTARLASIEAQPRYQKASAGTASTTSMTLLAGTRVMPSRSLRAALSESLSLGFHSISIS